MLGYQGRRGWGLGGLAVTLSFFPECHRGKGGSLYMCRVFTFLVLVYNYLFKVPKLPNENTAVEAGTHCKSPPPTGQ